MGSHVQAAELVLYVVQGRSPTSFFHIWTFLLFNPAPGAAAPAHRAMCPQLGPRQAPRRAGGRSYPRQLPIILPLPLGWTQDLAQSARILLPSFIFTDNAQSPQPLQACFSSVPRELYPVKPPLSLLHFGHTEKPLARWKCYVRSGPDCLFQPHPHATLPHAHCAPATQPFPAHPTSRPFYP